MTNFEVIQELYRAFREKDYDAFLHICAPSLEWIQNEGFPQGATYRGAEAVVSLGSSNPTTRVGRSSHFTLSSISMQGIQ